MSCPETDATLAYADLSPEDVLDALESLGFRCNGRLLALNSYENRVYRVGIEPVEAIVAKFYRPNRWTDDAILEEHQYSEALAAAEIPVVAPLRVDDATLHQKNGFRLAVYPCRGGRPPELDDYELLRQLGRFVARIHLIGETSGFAHRPRLGIDRLGRRSRDYLLDASVVPGDLIEAYAGVADQVIEGVEQCFDRIGEIPELRIHGDFHPGNVLVAEDRFHIVDLDDTCTGPAIQDLWMFLSGDRTEQTPQLAALLDGYESFRCFEAGELNLIEALRSLRIMHYAAWLARRWDDPAFKQAFPWFASRRYWDEHVLALREQIALMQEPPLEWRAYER